MGSAVLNERKLLRYGKGGGEWEERPLAEARPSGYVGAVAADDFNGDGRPDLALGYVAFQGKWRTGIDLFLTRPGGGWERRALAVEESRAALTTLATGDLDGDRRTDLVALTGEGRVWIFLADGKGGLAREDSPEVEPTKTACSGYRVAVADLDGDGRAEVIAAFSGESSALFAPDQCTEGGSLWVWKAQPKKTNAQTCTRPLTSPQGVPIVQKHNSPG